jgi:PAS domain S-box-containing protein
MRNQKSAPREDTRGTEQSPNHAALIKVVVLSLATAVALALLDAIGGRYGFLSHPYSDFADFAMVSILFCSTWYVIHMVYRSRIIDVALTVSVVLLLMSETLDVVEDLDALAVLSAKMKSAPSYDLVKDALAVAGVALFLAALYLCIFATEATKNRLAEETRRLREEMAERKRAEEGLRRREEEFRVLAETTTAATIIHQGGHFCYANSAAEEVSGYSRQELLEMDFGAFIHPDFREMVQRRGAQRLRGESPPSRYEVAILTKSGEKRWIEISLGLIEFEGQPAVLGAFFDITDRKAAEAERAALQAQVLQAQKLESLGILAGGVAHDFNNLLVGILGNADLALSELSPSSPARSRIAGIEKAAMRAADLSKQMLAYSGKGLFRIETIDLGATAREIGHLLDAAISGKAVLKYNLVENLPGVEADATQVRQVIMNLVINASEALGDAAGTITITTGKMACDTAYLKGTYFNDDLPEGAYVYLDVTDSGCGMDKATMSKVFDPFFSTKFTGRGLGLAAALGIVRGHRGALKVYSEPGKGTTFKALFPALNAPAQPARQSHKETADWRGTGTLLLVDDEETVRTVAKRMLENAGFSVITAEDGREAIDVMRRRGEEIVCVLLDLTMPHMDGEETFRELRKLKADVRVILSSGYNEQDVTSRFTGRGLSGFVQKPYQAATLIERLRSVLEPSA